MRVGMTRSNVLVDMFSRKHNYLRISLTEKCNLRCTYCMPADGVSLTPAPEMLTSEEIIRLGRVFVFHGVDKVRFTGGEPLVRPDCSYVVKSVASLPGITSCGITTNGVALRPKLPELVDSGLTHLNISLDTLDANLFQIMTRRKGFRLVMESIDSVLKNHPQLVLKINCVVIRGVNCGEILDFVEFTRERNVEVRFIEYMPFDGNSWRDGKMIPFFEMMDMITARYPGFTKLPPATPNETSKVYQVPGFVGRVGFITSMSNHFCHSCNRVRLTADGNLKVCLFGASEISLRDLIRDPKVGDDEIAQVISEAIDRKHHQHAGMHEIWRNAKENRPMIKIGG